MKSIQEIDNRKGKLLNPSFGLLVVFCVILYSLAVFQDYIFSITKFTGFYWTDTLLYNTYWLLFIPFIQFANFCYNKVALKSFPFKLLYASSTGILFSAVHIFLFTSIFILGSNMLYITPHRFSSILKTVIANQLHITILVYLFSPILFEYLKKKAQNHHPKTLKTITAKNGLRRIKIDISSILYITSDRPYTMIYTNDEKYLHDESLKKIESIINAQGFVRVHRSAIVNIDKITQLKSRRNGDFDGILTNGQSVRFSRHYRENWSELLNH